MMEERTEITPYRMNQLVEAAARITKQVCGANGTLHITYDEMRIILKAIELFMSESVEYNKGIKQEETKCS